ncbi:hypothetical protein Hypma_015315 [Hypsizygus marmoreus]|uniref:MIT domain-containing protein n=1 Tax=Hypsizygus marmoreus TaxID=39966 RepID=A0A369K5D5_HYPMA|nr:hypothetical protein Hypma_015315 [Hypsizygus marmoreus]
MAHRSRDWPERPLAAAAASSSSSSNSPSSFTTSTAFAQRRRSSAAHVRPAGPPPNLPIPSVPAPSLPAPPPQFGPVADLPDGPPLHINGRGTRSSSFIRPAPSPSLAAVVSFPRASSSHSPISATESSIEDLSDPPPLSFLYSSSSRMVDSQQDPPPDHSLLSPRESRPEHRVPSSRRALTRALELAREAVQLDSMNDNPEAAVQAYGRSVALLSEVMERVRRGEDSTDSHHRRRRRRSVAAQEEEIRRLQNIHDTYADRMNILSIIYSIPAAPYSSSTVYSALTDSTTSTSPTTSASPSSDSSPQIPQSTNVPKDIQSHYYTDGHPGHDRDFDSTEAMTSVMFSLDEATTGQSISGLPSTSQHPYAVQYDPPPQPTASTPAVSRTTTLTRRARALSNLPPPPPPPSNSLPPAPSPVVLEPVLDPVPTQQTLLDVRTRQRGESIGHHRAGSGGLEALQEELDDTTMEGARQSIDEASRIDPTHLIPDTPRNVKHNSHPLPPLPSPTSGSPGTPRTTAPKPPLSPRLASIAAPRPRGSSQLSTRSDSIHLPIINPSTNQGTIYQRRTTKSSAPPTPRSSSPADSTASAGSVVGSKSAASSLPGVTPISMAAGRSRSSSQPGRRPSLIGGRVSPLDQRPPLPGPAVVNGTGMRKASIPSKLNPNSQPMQLSVQTDLPPALSLAPPPPSFTGNLPTTPISPLPPAPPTDPLLQPYHLMNLLRNTMTSTTGGYITRRLHVPHEVWSQGGAKLSNVLEKVRVVAILCSALEDLQVSSSEHFGAGNVSSGLALGIGSVGRKEADAWLSRLEDFSSICDGVVTNFGKKLGVGEGFVLKKTTWGDKLTRSFDKFTNGKNLDSPAAYVRGLEKLFLHAQLLDEHTKAVLSQPVAPAYAAFPTDIRTSTEQKLKRVSEFFASVVLTFVIRDLSQLLDKYAKKCEKWLAE